MGILAPIRRNGKPTRTGPLTRRIADSIDDFGSEFACDALQTERRFLTIAYHYPADMHAVACDVGLTGSAFISDDHSFVFACIGLSVEAGLPLFITEVERLSVECGIGMTPMEIDDLCGWITWDDDDDPASELPDLARIIVLMADRRERAKACLAEFVKLTRGNPIMAEPTLKGVHTVA